jgi:peptidoglycan hydrolase-like protein with peptidoglycan-binding domain/beta-N-acetylglucosaminidase
MIDPARRRVWRVAVAVLGLAAIALGGLRVTPAAASGPWFVQLVRYVSTSNPENGIEHATEPAGWSASGYRAEGTLGYVFTSPVDGATTPLYECLVGSWDHMTSTDPACEGQSTASRVFLGYAFPKVGSGSGVASGPSAGLPTVLLKRCQATKDHFDSNSSTCEGLTEGGVLAFLLKLDVPGDPPSSASPVPLDLESSSCPADVSLSEDDGCVTELQILLNDHRSSTSQLTVDGDFGSATQAAVETYQGQAGVTVDGIVGPATKASLFGQPIPTAAPVPTPVPTTAPAVVPSGEHTITLPAGQWFVQLVRYVDTHNAQNGIEHATLPAGSTMAGYSAEGTLGYAFTSPADGATQPLYECFIGGWDYMTSTSLTCEGQGVTGQLLGYVFPKKVDATGGVVAGPSADLPTVQLKRCMIRADHFDSTQSNCEEQTAGGVLAYLLKLDVPGDPPSHSSPRPLDLDPTSSSCPTDMGEGENSGCVTELQILLNDHRSSTSQLTVNGSFDAATVAAVKTYQGQKGLTVDGIVGPDTKNSLLGEASPASGGGSGSSGSGTIGTPKPRCTQSTFQEQVVCYAQEALAGTLSVSGGANSWTGGEIPYSWGSGHGASPGPSKGGCGDYETLSNGTKVDVACPPDPPYSERPSSTDAPNVKGLDCSGFTRWIYALASGVDLLGSGPSAESVANGVPTGGQISQAEANGGKIVPEGEAKAGDLVYFRDDHVAIYMGEWTGPAYEHTNVDNLYPTTEADDQTFTITDGTRYMIDEFETMNSVQADPISFSTATPMVFVHFNSVKTQPVATSTSPTLDASFTVDTNLTQPSGVTAAFIKAFLAKKYVQQGGYRTSPLVNDAQYFVDAEKTYHVNAQFLLALAIDESGWGTKPIAPNNFFGYTAYDNCPKTCAASFPNAQTGIMEVAKDIEQTYLTKGGEYYVPAYGPTLLGMNQHWSTNNPGWSSTINTLANEMSTYAHNGYQPTSVIVGVVQGAVSTGALAILLIAFLLFGAMLFRVVTRRMVTVEAGPGARSQWAGPGAGRIRSLLRSRVRAGGRDAGSGPRGAP